ncbi:MAG TPA: hypothetical protein VGF45_07285 [Polyangia bacterium]
MSQKSLWLIFLAATMGATSVGCDGQVPADEPTSQQASALTAQNGLAWNGLAWNGLAYNGLSFNGLSWNGLAYNGLAYNGLSFNGMSYNGLAYNGLSWNGLSYNGLSYNGLSDPTVNQFVSYLIECALPEGDSVSYDINGSSYTFHGSLGLAPAWKTQSCDQSCQRWVSACMLARLNKLGSHMEISLRGEHPALKAPKSETKTYDAREASYYGNLFAGPEQIFTCLAPSQSAIPRVCGDSLADCPMNVVGPCAQACRGTTEHGAFRNCETTAPAGGKSADAYSEVITVFLDVK